MSQSSIEFGTKIIDIFNLPKEIVWLEIRAAVNEPVTIKFEMIARVENDEVHKLLKKYKLVEIE